MYLMREIEYMDAGERARVEQILYKIKHDKNVQSMQEYIQHGNVSTYQHCEKVAEMAYMINKELLIGAMLHDFYLYDWHIKDRSHRLHGYHHADRALDNEVRYFDVDERIQHIIWCHMWPLNINRLPKTKEAIIVCIADKICSAKEILFQR